MNKFSLSGKDRDSSLAEAEGSGALLSTHSPTPAPISQWWDENRVRWTKP